MRGSWRVFVAFRITRPFEFTIGEPRPRILLKRTFQTICHHEKLKTKDAPTWERSLHGQTLSLPHRRRSVFRFVVLRTRRRLPVPQPMLLAHRSGAVRYRKEHFPLSHIRCASFNLLLQFSDSLVLVGNYPLRVCDLLFVLRGFGSWNNVPIRSTASAVASTSIPLNLPASIPRRGCAGSSAFAGSSFFFRHCSSMAS